MHYKLSVQVICCYAAWRAAPDSTAEVIAERFGGAVPSPIRAMDPNADGGYLRAIKDFARSAEVGAVSDPIEVGGSLRVFRVVDRTSRAARPFDDPAVQTEIQTLLSSEHLDEVEEQVLDWKLRELAVYPPELRRALSLRARN